MLLDQNADSGKINEPQERIVGLVIARGNSPEPLHYLKKALYQMALFVQTPITFSLNGSISFGGNHGNSSTFRKILYDSVGIICSISQNIAALNLNSIEQLNGMGRVVIVTRRQKEVYRVSQPINHDMDFRVQSASGATYGLFFAPFLPPLALW